MKTFGDHLVTLVGNAQLTMESFAKQVGLTKGFLSKVRNGKKPPPIDRLESWADALGLRGAARQEFIDLGNLAHAPEHVRTMVERLRGEVERARRR